MNLVSIATGGLAGVLSSGLSGPTTAGPLGVLASDVLGSVVGGSNSRDALLSSLPDILGSVNGLQQAAAGTSSGGTDPSTSLSPSSLPAMPKPAQQPPAPTDDNGTSNVVFSDSDADGSLIH